MNKKINLDDITAEALSYQIYDKQLKLQEAVNNQFIILHGVTDEGSLVLDKDENVLASTPSEKIDLVISELISLKEEAIMLEKFEGFIDEYQEALQKQYEQ